MSSFYNAFNDDLFYSAEIPSTIQLNENFESPARPRRFLGSNTLLTPTLTRSPLQTLKQTPEGLLYSPMNQD